MRYQPFGAPLLSVNLQSTTGVWNVPNVSPVRTLTDEWQMNVLDTQRCSPSRVLLSIHIVTCKELNHLKFERLKYQQVLLPVHVGASHWRRPTLSWSPVSIFKTNNDGLPSCVLSLMKDYLSYNSSLQQRIVQDLQYFNSRFLLMSPWGVKLVKLSVERSNLTHSFWNISSER